MKKVMLITGGSSDICKKIYDYYKLEYEIIVIYNNKYYEYDNKIKCDITNEDSVKKLSNLIKDKYKKIDVLINIASYEFDCDYNDKNLDSFIKPYIVNVYGNFLMYKYMIDLGVNKIVTFSSTDSVDTYNDYNLEYALSKCSLNKMNEYFVNKFNNVNYLLLILNYINNKKTREMDSNYLSNELIRVKQDKLIEIDDIIKKIDVFLKDNKTYVVRMD